jgi:hypothetical protein
MRKQLEQRIAQQSIIEVRIRMNGPIHLRVRYRPIRIGWCIQAGDIEEYRRALRLTHTLWGGRFNPLIPVGDPDLARLLIKAFRVDCLYFISKSTEGSALDTEFAHLLWPGIGDPEIFIDRIGGGRLATFLDVYHPAAHFHESNIKDKVTPTRTGTLVRWDPVDPLADVFLATFGAYPGKDEIGLEYGGLFRGMLGNQEVEIGKDSVVWPDLAAAFTPSTLTAVELHSYRQSWGWYDPGLYHGECGDFTDLVNFWNLRACGIDLQFYDPALRPRLSELVDNHLTKLRARPADPRGITNRISIWNKSRDMKMDVGAFGADLILPTFSSGILNGLNLNPTVVAFEEKAVLGLISDNTGASAAFELPPKPFFDGPEFYMQKVVVSVHPLLRDENAVLQPPFLPLLNEYYGREIHLYNTVRSEPEGVGIITDLTTHSLSIRALDVRTLVSRIFGAFGISANPSDKGLIGSRLIAQMGSLQDCRVFKIGGVRELIYNHSPSESFTRSCANQTIRNADPVSGVSGFSAYESLFIEPRDFGSRLKAEDAFTYLLKKGVFRAGLKFVCETCQLKSWVHLDDARTINRCEYCGKDFNVMPQLKDRDWEYRRSGLFGRDDHQGGGIPVSLTLLQLQAALGDHFVAYATGTELEPTTARIEKCETDFVLIAEKPAEKTLQVVIGECKSNKEISSDDVQKLGLVADALVNGGTCEAFIVFAKTSSFTPEEVDRCKAAQGQFSSRVILLSGRELEPYYLYEQAVKEFEISPYASSLEQMAEATQGIYFAPRPQVQPEQIPTALDAGPPPATA